MNFSKIIIISMLVMLICCVSAVSATDINGTDNAGDVIVTDEVTGIVEELNIDDTQDDVADEGNLRGGANSINVNSTNYVDYFDTSSGYITTSSNLTFNGNFENIAFDTFKINRNVVIDASNATFTNIGFYLETSQIVLNGGTFIGNENTNLTSVIYVTGSHNEVSDVTINITAPENKDCYAFDLETANYAQILNNNIYYVDTYANTENYNYAVKVKGGSENNMSGNTIIVSVPLKDVDYTNWTTRFPTIDLDLVAGVAVESSGKFNFENNTLNVTGSLRGGYDPTLDAFIIVKTDNAKIIGNKIYERDNASAQNDRNYLYAVDIYRCEAILVDSNEIRINTDGGKVTTNGTGAAYGIQLTGWHANVVISNNNITTANNGPNLGIYSQNAQASTALTITRNNINVTGRAGTNNYNLVSGMELQDTYDTITWNNITVNNIGEYVANETYIFGISYCQETIGPHTFYMDHNNVTVNNGGYAVYLLEGSRGEVYLNDLTVTNGTSIINNGDSAVFPISTVDVYDNS